MKLPAATRFALALALAPAGLLSGCRASSRGPAPWFADASEEVGLNFVHDAGQAGEYFMPEIVGSGAALFDFDNDGRLDVYLIQNGGPASRSTNRLFHQGPDSRFADVTAGSGLEIAGRGMGAAAGDANNDGWCDLLVTEYGETRLFLNGGGTFTDVTREAGIDNPSWGTSAAWADFDRDGWLDLVIANYIVYSATRPCTDQAGRRDFCGPDPFPGSVARLYRNLGRAAGTAGGGSQPAGVRFEDVTVSSGLGRAPAPGLGVVCADFNGDRWPDIFIANDLKPNHLWISQQNGKFLEEAVLRGVALNGMGQAQADMGIALGDVNDDGLLDLYITHLTEQLHVLYVQGPRGYFTDRTAVAGLAGPHWRSTGFGTVFGDFDQDGDLDLAQVNGRVKYLNGPSPPGSPFWEVYKERNQLFSNDGSGKFVDISLENEPLCGTGSVARGLAVGDIDNNGALDLLVTAVAGPARLYRNTAQDRGHWLLVRAVDPALGGRDAYGAEVTVRAGDRRWLGLLNPAQSYLNSNDPRLHFGLGKAERVDAIEVVWPDGAEEVFGVGRVDQVVLIRKGEGTKRGAETSR